MKRSYEEECRITKVTDINYIGGRSLGKIQAWANKKVGKLTPVTFPTRDSGWVEAVDEMGIFETIDFQGRWTGKFEQIQTNIAQIKRIADGQQTSSQSLKSPFVNTNEQAPDPDDPDVLRIGNIAVNTTLDTNKLIDSSGGFVAKGIQINDLVKNLVTGEIAEVAAIDSATTLSLREVGGGAPKQLFTVANTAYAVTATMQCKVLNIDVTWGLPGLSWCDYKITVVQVNF